MKNLFLGTFLYFLTIPAYAQKNILFFISQQDTYYSEYIVMKEALQNLGYTIDLRSATSDPVSTYMVPSNTTIEATANTLSGSSYAAFQTQYQQMFGAAWNSTLNTIPPSINTQGSILDIANLTTYDALVIAGGTGILDYRYDGSYTAQGTVSASVVQQVAEKLNSLALEALSKGKPVLAQCHGASLPIHWRVPGTTGSGVETMGFSVLKNQDATGYPETETATLLSNFGVNYLPESKVVVSTPHENFDTGNKGNYKIITTRDWYPQTVAYAARSMANLLETYPSSTQRSAEKTILILHGGALNPSNCSPANRLNDVPCNYGTGTNLPADYTHLSALLTSISPQDEFNFAVENLDITAASLPFDGSNSSSILTYFNNYDVIIFFKHWSTGLTTNIQNALRDYAEDGGGLLTLHHGLYNDVDGSLNKNILANLFQIESSMSGWSANLTNYSLFSTNYGHFISTYGMSYPDATLKPSGWSGTSLLNGSNFSDSYYSAFSIYDELYNNMSFINTPVFGRGLNEITPLFSHGTSPSSIYHTAGFVKLYNTNSDSKTGRLAFFQAGERPDNLTVNHPYGQVIRNAVFWASIDAIEQEPEDVSAAITRKTINHVALYPNPAQNVVYLKSQEPITKVNVFDLHGKSIQSSILNQSNEVQIRFEEETTSIVFIQVQTSQGQQVYKLIRE